MTEIFDVKEALEEDNGRYAEKVRQALAQSHTYLINLMGSPGAGKSSVLLRLAEKLPRTVRLGVIEADVDSDVDAAAMRRAGLKAVQLHTQGACHMDAKMTLEGLSHLGCEDVDLAVLENVGNLVCPAEFDVGANLKMTILSVPEGDDKPLKYPLMFQVTDLVVVNKIDTAPIFDFDLDRLKKNIEPLHQHMPILPVSAKTGEGMEELAAYIHQKLEDPSWK